MGLAFGDPRGRTTFSSNRGSWYDSLLDFTNHFITLRISRTPGPDTTLAEAKASGATRCEYCTSILETIAA